MLSCVHFRWELDILVKRHSRLQSRKLTSIVALWGVCDRPTRSLLLVGFFSCNYALHHEHFLSELSISLFEA
jgi:hypothetical protein